ncbi:hypothetical protein [Acinetobacter defluvii]|uniref:hypothetical protein n=1 Tax=Acinetobacter defluvii TaxID=1871111 RepID=UPI003AF6C067
MESQFYSLLLRTKEPANLQGNSFTILKVYDVFGQRIQKLSNIAGITLQVLFIYNENGQFLSKYTPDGKLIRGGPTCLNN